MKKIIADDYLEDHRAIWHRLLRDGLRGMVLITLLGVAFGAGQFVTATRIPSKSAQIAVVASHDNAIALKQIQIRIRNWNLDSRLARIETTQALILDELRELRQDRGAKK